MDTRTVSTSVVDVVTITGLSMPVLTHKVAR